MLIVGLALALGLISTIFNFVSENKVVGPIVTLPPLISTLPLISTSPSISKFPLISTSPSISTFVREYCHNIII